MYNAFVWNEKTQNCEFLRKCTPEQLVDLAAALDNRGEDWGFTGW